MLRTKVTLFGPIYLAGTSPLLEVRFNSVVLALPMTEILLLALFLSEQCLL